MKKLQFPIVTAVSVAFYTIGITPLSAVAATITFSDSTFNNTDWSLTTFVQGGSGTTTASQEPSGGNPGEYRSISNSLNVGTTYTTLWGIHIQDDATYNPQNLGLINSINYSEDAINFGFGQGQATGAALTQNNKVYISTTNAPLITPETVWTNKQLTGLNATNFILVENGGVDPTSHPDFSATGSQINFGFFRANSGNSSYSIEGGIDNWSVAVNYQEQEPIPEPSAVLSLLAFGAFGALAQLKRRQKQKAIESSIR